MSAPDQRPRFEDLLAARAEEERFADDHGSTPECLPFAELRRLAQSPVSEPLPSHVDDCPRCRALIGAFRRRAEGPQRTHHSRLGPARWRRVAGLGFLAAAAGIALYVLIDGGAPDDPKVEPELAELVQRARPADANADVLSLNVERRVVASIRGVTGDFRVGDGEIRRLEAGVQKLDVPSSWVAALLVIAKQPDVLESASIPELIRSLERRWLPQEVPAETRRYLPGVTRESFEAKAASVVEALARSQRDWTLSIDGESFAVRFFWIREPSSTPPGPGQWVVAIAPTESSLLAMTTRARSGVSSDVSWTSGELWVDVTTATSASLALIGVDAAGRLHELGETHFDADAEESATFGPIEAPEGSKLRQVIVLASASETKLRAELESVSNGSLEANRDRWITKGLLIGEYELPD